MKHKPPPIVAPIAFLKNCWLTHGLFWLIVISVQATSLYGLSDFTISAMILALETVYMMIFTYIILWALIPHLLYTTRFFYFIIMSILLIIIASYCDYKTVVFFYKGVPNIEELSFFTSMPLYVLFLFMVTAIKLGKDLLIVNYENEIAQKQQLQQELNFLKAQLSPHFLLNTMNNLYGLSVIKSNDLPPLMLRLSDLLRYTLYDTKNDKVALKNEVEYLRDYVALQKIRLSAKVQLQVDFSDNIPENLTIAPLLLVTFVENAFKHSQNYTLNQAPFIYFHLSEKDGFLHFISENSFEKAEEKHDNFKLNTEGGVGLQNTLRRIELLYGKENLPIIATDNNCYKVELNLKLDDAKN